jgi:tetratricopeptide (TPR) repeat protein
MYDYNRRRKIGPVTILFLFLFSASIVGLAVISYLDRGRFWDILPYFCIPVIVLSLIIAIYNLVRRCNAGFVFILFFIIFTVGLVLSSVFGPFALRREAVDSIEENDYSGAIEKFDSILINYPNSRHAAEALNRISFAYYHNNQFSQALRSFDEAINKNIIDPDQLEVLEIRQDIYYHLAQERESVAEYLKAADNYLSSVDILKQIRSDFPDTNEAFISQYKIPQYLFNASEDYKKSGDLISQIELLEEIISGYPESDQYQAALASADNAYIEHAALLSEAAQFEDAIERFLKYLENNPEPERDAILDYKIKRVFGEAPPSVIKRYADASYDAEKYLIAVFLYETLIDFYPHYFGKPPEGLVESKIILAGSSPYNEILQSTSGKYINTPGLSLLIIKNDSGNTLTVYIKGPENHMASVPAGETVEIELIPDEYTVLVESADREILTYMGTLSFEEYRKYTEVFEEAGEDNGS